MSKENINNIYWQQMLQRMSYSSFPIHLPQTSLERVLRSCVVLVPFLLWQVFFFFVAFLHAVVSAPELVEVSYSFVSKSRTKLF